MDDRLEILDKDTLVIVSEERKDRVAALAEHCRHVRDSGKNTSRGDMTHVASIPIYVVKEFCNIKGCTWQQFMRDDALKNELLAQQETRVFRTWAGKL